MTPAQEIFEYWKEKTGHPKAVYLPERARLLNGWLKYYTVAQLKQVVDGWKESDYHRKRGLHRQRSGPVYDDLSLLFRSGAKIEGFMAMAKAAGEIAGAKPRGPREIVGHQHRDPRTGITKEARQLFTEYLQKYDPKRRAAQRKKDRGDS